MLKRESNFELLRIVAMLMIVFHHFAFHGGFNWESTAITIPRLWYNFIMMGGKVGVNLFILISGYFLILNKGINIKKIFKMLGQVFFYSILFLNTSGGGIRTLVANFFPILSSKWWFASTYFVLYLIHPFLNIFLRNLDKKKYQNLLVGLVFLWSIIPTFTSFQLQLNDLLWFTVLYAIAGYIRLYGLNKKYTVKTYFWLWVLFSLLTYFSSVILTIVDIKFDAFKPSYVTYFYGVNTVSVLLISLTLFMTFVKLKINYNKWINVVASSTFGIYLIHDNAIIRKLLWIDLFKNASYQNSILLIPYSIGVVILVFIVCSIIDLIRQQTIEKLYMFLVNKYINNFLSIINKLNLLIKNIVFGQDDENN